jgi:F-type H+-transporting ATPase subunit b
MVHSGWMLLSQIIVASEGAKQPSIIYFDWTLLYQMALFLLLMAYLSKVLFAPMMKVFDAREQAHIGREQLAKEVSAKAQQSMEKYNALRSDAYGTAERIRSELAHDAGEMQKKILNEARLKADAIVAEARDEMASSRVRLVQELPGRADSLASMLAERLLGRS